MSIINLYERATFLGAMRYNSILQTKQEPVKPDEINGKNMKNLMNTVCNEKKAQLADFIKEVDKVKAIEELTKKYTYYSYLIPRGKDLSKFTLKEAKAYIIRRKEKMVYGEIEREIKRIETVMNAGTLISVKISVEWKRSRMWGMNPTADAWATFLQADGNTHSQHVTSGPIGGCGYDKLSTAVANVLNQFDEVLKQLYTVKNRPKNIEKSNRDVFGYGAGYGLLPRFEGGVGTDCYRPIFEKIGYKFERVANGKTFDVFQITKK